MSRCDTGMITSSSNGAQNVVHMFNHITDDVTDIDELVSAASPPLHLSFSIHSRCFEKANFLGNASKWENGVHISIGLNK